MNIYLVHCWDGYTTQGDVTNWHPPWYDWLAEQFPKGTVTILKMPNSNTPKINEWLAHLEKSITTIDKNTFFVGHSVGCQTIMRYLEVKKPSAVGGVILVAGWFTLTNLETPQAERIAKPWIETPINFTTLATYKEKIHVVLSDDDPFVPLVPNADIFKKFLSNNVVIQSKQGHFDATKTIPLLKEILEK